MPNKALYDILFMNVCKWNQAKLSQKIFFEEFFFSVGLILPRPEMFNREKVGLDAKKVKQSFLTHCPIQT